MERLSRDPLDPLTPNPNRYTTFPIRYNGLWDLYKKAVGSFWTVDEIDMSGDLKDWVKLTYYERDFIKMILAFFAASDGIIMENIDLNFASEVQIPEARSFYAYQAFNESIHSETYSLMINKLIKDPEEESRLLASIQHVPEVRDKANWALKWLDKKLPFEDRLIAFACVEGIFFSGSFCAIFWLKKRGVMPGLCFSNELISRDEGLHQTFAVELYKLLNKKCDYVKQIVADAVECESRFIENALKVSVVGIHAKDMIQYIQFVADRLLNQLDLDKMYNVDNPFYWMENISLEGKTNFFEKRVGDYSKHVNDSIRFDESF
jgi:ribonucleotide reductase beta subunit family protein with ferritin-like domain